MRGFTDGGLEVRGLTGAEKTALLVGGKRLGLASISETLVWLARQFIAEGQTGKSRTPKDMPRMGGSRIKHKLSQWRIPGSADEPARQGRPRKKNSLSEGPSHHSSAPVQPSTQEEAS
jgi:hypothetical protein